MTASMRRDPYLASFSAADRSGEVPAPTRSGMAPVFGKHPLQHQKPETDDDPRGFGPFRCAPIVSCCVGHSSRQPSTAAAWPADSLDFLKITSSPNRASVAISKSL